MAHSNAVSFNPLREARDQSRILMDTSQVLNLLSYNRSSQLVCFLAFIRKTLPWSLGKTEWVTACDFPTWKVARGACWSPLRAVRAKLL